MHNKWNKAQGEIEIAKTGHYNILREINVRGKAPGENF